MGKTTKQGNAQSSQYNSHPIEIACMQPQNFRRQLTVTKDKTRGFQDQSGNYCHIQNVLTKTTKNLKRLAGASSSLILS